MRDRLKRAVLKRLKDHPALLGVFRRIYRTLFPVPVPAPAPELEVQQHILKNLSGKESVFFVQVGSNDGIHGDPLHDIIATNINWKGMFVEPVSFLFERLVRNYGFSERFIFENKAIAPNRGVVEFFYVSEKAKAKLGDELPFWYDQLGSFDKNHILKHLDGVLEPYIVCESIDTVTLQDIFDKHAVTSIDLIHIDTEGYDYKILSTLDFSKYQPSIILYEHMHLSDVEKNAAESLLRDNGYRCVQYAGDTLATINR